MYFREGGRTSQDIKRNGAENDQRLKKKKKIVSYRSLLLNYVLSIDNKIKSKDEVVNEEKDDKEEIEKEEKEGEEEKKCKRRRKGRK